MLKIHDLCAGYGMSRVLSGVSFSLDKGLTVLLGQNGSGKTTLLRSICGAVKPLSGEISLDGEDLINMSVKKRARNVCLMSSSRTDMPGLTGSDLAEMALMPSHSLFFRMSAQEKAAVMRTAEELGADELMDRRLESLSSGERQLMELTAAVCQDTRVLLLDEPTSSLDFSHSHALMSKIRVLSNEKTVLATLHDPGLALEYADRILILKDGKIAADFVSDNSRLKEAESFLSLIYPDLKIIDTQNGPVAVHSSQIHSCGKEST